MTDGQEDFASRMERLREQTKTRLLAFRRGLLAEIEQAEINDNDVIGMAEAFVHAKNAFDDIQEAFKSAAAALELVSKQKFPSALEKSPLVNVPLENLGVRVQTSTRTSCSIVKGRREDAFDYLRADSRALSALECGEYEIAAHNLILGDRKALARTLERSEDKEKTAREIAEEVQSTTLHLEELVTETVNQRTLSSTAKNLANDHGIELPDEIFNTYLATTTSAVRLPNKP